MGDCVQLVHASIMTMENANSISHNNEGERKMKDQAWQEILPDMQQIRAEGGFAALAARLPEATQKLLAGECTTLCCMDGRIAPHEDGIAVAGSGILIKDDPQKRAQFIAALKAYGV